MNTKTKPWYRGAIVYQIYPRSFQDTTGNGVGDLPGIIKRLDYLNDGKGGGLGVDAIWLSPFYTSPMADFGYDVADYCDVDPLFGTIDDFDELIRQAHKRNIKVLVDFVPNHTSIEHPWFQQARSSKTSDKRDWYVWRDGNSDGSLPNNWLSVFGGSAWEFDAHSKQYYLHSFLKEQPDLNWDNPDVRDEMAKIMRFWLDRGVDGFRIDATDHIGKSKEMTDEPPAPHDSTDDPYGVLEHIYSKNAGDYHEHMHFIASVLAHYPEKVAIFETWMHGQRKTQLLLDFYDSMPKPNAMPFNFELIDTPWEASAFKQRIDTFQAGLGEDHVPVYVLGNHDRPRLASRIGADAAKTAVMLELTLPGIALVYYGDEIGMQDIELKPEDMQDPFGKKYPTYGRDVARSPMQWSTGTYAGFSDVKPWLPVHPNKSTQNVSRQQKAKHSTLKLYEKLIALRHEHPALSEDGEYIPYTYLTPGLFVFERKHEDSRIRIILNFTDEKKNLSGHLQQGELLLSTYDDKRLLTSIRPHEGIIKQL